MIFLYRVIKNSWNQGDRTITVIRQSIFSEKSSQNLLYDQAILASYSNSNVPPKKRGTIVMLKNAITVITQFISSYNQKIRIKISQNSLLTEN